MNSNNNELLLCFSAYSTTSYFSFFNCCWCCLCCCWCWCCRCCFSFFMFSPFDSSSLVLLALFGCAGSASFLFRSSLHLHTDTHALHVYLYRQSDTQANYREISKVPTIFSLCPENGAAKRKKSLCFLALCNRLSLCINLFGTMSGNEEKTLFIFYAFGSQWMNGFDLISGLLSLLYFSSLVRFSGQFDRPLPWSTLRNTLIISELMMEIRHGFH